MTLNHRYEFVYLFEVKDGNPNGDPDAGNFPRIDSETGHGLVTDVCLKRKIRNYVTIAKKEQPPYEIYIKEKAILNDQNRRGHDHIGNDLSKDTGKRKGSARAGEAGAWMCQNFYDIRTFGAVMNTGINCGQVKGPVQLTFARSLDPIVSTEHTITRMAVTTTEEAEKQDQDNRTMGRKHTVPYGLYRAHGFISAHFAQQTNFSEDDLGIFWESLCNMFDHDHSAARGMMSPRGLYVFKHSSLLGNSQAHVLFDLITVRKRQEIAVPREFSHYEVLVNRDALPNNVSLQQMI
jgi:CRISPR-associated protein Csd2